MEIRGKEMRQRLLDAGLPTNAAGDRILFPREIVERAIATAPKAFTLFDRDGNPHADLGGDRVHFVPGSSGLKWLDHRTGEVRLADSTDFVEYVRLADGLHNIAYLATAFSTNADIEADVSDAWRLYMVLTNSKKPVVSGRLHRARRAAHGRDDAALPGRPGRPHRPPDVHLHDHRDRQLPVLRGLLPEPHRLRRGGHPGRDRAGHADGPHRPGDGRRRDGLPHGGRAGRHHHGPDRPAGRAGPVRRGAGHVPHEDRLVADVGHRGAPAGRRLRGRGQAPGAALPVVHGPVRRAHPGCPGRRRDVRQRAHRGPGRGQQRERPGHARLPARVQPAQARLRRRDVRPGAALRARDQGRRRPAGRGRSSTS